jgi:hypothetical protein
VERRNDIVEPLLAPCLCSDIETGMTPHEHRGNGIPKTDAFSKGKNPLPPRCLSTSCCETSTDNSPATKKPNNKYGDISAIVCQKSVSISLIKSTIVYILTQRTTAVF